MPVYYSWMSLNVRKMRKTENNFQRVPRLVKVNWNAFSNKHLFLDAEDQQYFDQNGLASFLVLSNWYLWKFRNETGRSSKRWEKDSEWGDGPLSDTSICQIWGRWWLREQNKRHFILDTKIWIQIEKSWSNAKISTELQLVIL